MATLTEGNHSLEFLLSEANGARSRATGTLITGQDLAAGVVLGTITASGKYTQLAEDASDGSEAASAVLATACDATDADQTCVVIVRDAEVSADMLGWNGTIDAGEIVTATAELAALGIIAR